MIVFELVNREDHPVYQALEISNSYRHYDFLHSIVTASLDIGKPFLSQQIIKALNFHAIACLHINAGEYRPCEVEVAKGTHLEFHPPPFYRVPPLMDDLVNTVNRWWEGADPVVLATYVLWRVNHIHPFINGNGRTARAACYFVLCLKSGGLLQGSKILPELIKQNHQEYCEALQAAHVSYLTTGNVDLRVLHALVSRLLNEQKQSAQPAPAPMSPILTPASAPTPQRAATPAPKGRSLIPPRKKPIGSGWGPP